MERLFDGGLGSAQLAVAQAMDKDDAVDAFIGQVQRMISDTVDYELSFLGPKREEHVRYYRGLEPKMDEDINKSKVVSTDVRDTILTILPSLIRIFASDEHVVNVLPNSEDQVDMASQMTDYINYVIWEDNEGFLTFHSLFKDALSVRGGIVKWWIETEEDYSVKKFFGFSQQQMQAMIMEDKTAEIVSSEPNDDVDDTGQPLFDFTIRFKINKPLIKCAPVPPEEFRIDRYATCMDEARIMGHERIAQPSELVKMGYDVEEIKNYITSGGLPSWTEEKYLRNDALNESTVMDEGVVYGEYFIRIDADGDGIDELHKICTLGDNRDVVADELVETMDFAVFCADPVPHTIMGGDITELVMDIQKIKTNMIRGVLDSLSTSNNPRPVINEMLTNVEDAMNDEVGAIIRTKGDVNAAVGWSNSPFVGQQALPVINYFDDLRAARTGITEASKGLDPKAMQSTTLTGIDAIVAGAQERIELIARILAETGMKRWMRGILRAICAAPNAKRTIQVRGNWVNVDPTTWDPNLRMKVNPQLGRGTDIMRLQALGQIKQDQLMVIQQWGINNPFVGPQELMNTVTDMLSIANIKNVSRYFKPVTPEILAAMQNQPKQPDPATVLAQSELEKIKANINIKLAELHQKDVFKMMDDDYRRDKLAIDSLLVAADIEAKDGANVRDNAVIQAHNQANVQLKADQNAADKTEVQQSGSPGAGGGGGQPPA